MGCSKQRRQLLTHSLHAVIAEGRPLMVFLSRGFVGDGFLGRFGGKAQRGESNRHDAVLRLETDKRSVCREEV